MKTQQTRRWQHAHELAAFLLDQHDGHLTVAMPLGLGKANHLINAIYQLVKDKPALSLTILTALSLQTPRPKPGLEQHFFAPISKRLYEGYPELLYARDLISGAVPDNVTVSEFFLQAGVFLKNEHAQGNYISANYSHVSTYLKDRKIDLILQMVAREEQLSTDLSLSCNPDITLELLNARAEGKLDFDLIGEVNNSLPFMGNDAQLSQSEFAHVLEGECTEATLFNVPKPAIELNEYAAGFHASSLVKDGGTLQLGIGATGDAVAYALIMRHTDNANYRRVIAALNGEKSVSHLHLEPFDVGLYGVSEMFVDVFLDLLEAGVIKREINGVLIHGGFFVGPNSLYQRLRELPVKVRDRINMTAIGYINGAHVDFANKQQNRQHARFINNALKATAMGAVVSDGLDSGAVVSGVGGQYDFVRQAFALHDARSIIMLKAVRNVAGKLSSNIVWSYGHTTIPRHLRDVIINEYGIADLRGAPDSEVIERMLSITDVQFQEDLLETAKANSKIKQCFELNPQWRVNSGARLQQIMTPFVKEGLLPNYPFGTDFSELEQRLIPILRFMVQARKSKPTLVRLAAKGLVPGVTPFEKEALLRLGLDRPNTVSERMTRWVFLGASRKTHLVTQ